MQPLISSKTIEIVPARQVTHKHFEAALFIVIACTTVLLTPLLVLQGKQIGFGFVLGILTALALVVVVIRWPLVGLYVAAGCALLVEENPLPVPTSILTDNLYIFYWPSNLEGLFERPIGFLFLTLLFALVCKRLLKRERLLGGGVLLLPFLLFLLCVLAGVAYGLASGGDLKITVVEVRPFWYLFVSYLLAYNLITHKNQIRTFFWIVILSAGVKGLQGVYIYLIVLHGSLQGVDTIMSHEESFFFAALLLLLILFRLHYRYRPQFYSGLLVLPFVLISLVANQRRTDYIALLVGIIVAWSLIFLIKRQARKGLLILLFICLVLSITYIGAFSGSSQWYAQPAYAIVSIFNPDLTDSRDINSNLYRYIEDNDLKYTIKQYPLGLGFGKPFLQPVPLTSVFPQILVFDPYYNYIPHNNIYWVWIRLGPIGYLAFWYLLGAIIVRGCLTARMLRDPYLQLVAIYVVAITFMEVIVAFADYQLFFYRNVIYVGLLVGIMMKLSALDEQKETTNV